MHVRAEQGRGSPRIPSLDDKALGRPRLRYGKEGGLAGLAMPCKVSGGGVA